MFSVASVVDGVFGSRQNRFDKKRQSEYIKYREERQILSLSEHLGPVRKEMRRQVLFSLLGSAVSGKIFFEGSQNNG